MSQQGEQSFAQSAGSPPGNMMPGHMGPGQNPMMQQHQGGSMYQAADMKGWAPQAGMVRSK